MDNNTLKQIMNIYKTSKVYIEKAMENNDLNEAKNMVVELDRTLSQIYYKIPLNGLEEYRKEIEEIHSYYYAFRILILQFAKKNLNPKEYRCLLYVCNFLTEKINIIEQSGFSSMKQIGFTVDKTDVSYNSIIKDVSTYFVGNVEGKKKEIKDMRLQLIIKEDIQDKVNRDSIIENLTGYENEKFAVTFVNYDDNIVNLRSLDKDVATKEEVVVEEKDKGCNQLDILKKNMTDCISRLRKDIFKVENLNRKDYFSKNYFSLVRDTLNEIVEFKTKNITVNLYEKHYSDDLKTYNYENVKIKELSICGEINAISYSPTEIVEDLIKRISDILIDKVIVNYKPLILLTYENDIIRFRIKLTCLNIDVKKHIEDKSNNDTLRTSTGSIVFYKGEPNNKNIERKLKIKTKEEYLKDLNNVLAVLEGCEVMKNNDFDIKKSGLKVNTENFVVTFKNKTQKDEFDFISKEIKQKLVNDMKNEDGLKDTIEENMLIGSIAYSDIRRLGIDNVKINYQNKISLERAKELEFDIEIKFDANTEVFNIKLAKINKLQLVEVICASESNIWFKKEYAEVDRVSNVSLNVKCMCKLKSGTLIKFEDEYYNIRPTFMTKGNEQIYTAIKINRI